MDGEMDVTEIGRRCELDGEPECAELEEGLDFRQPRYRREVFLRFYEFHTRYGAHPGAVYYLMPYLADRFGWGIEERLWFAFLNGNTQNPLTSHLLFRAFPDFAALDLDRFERWVKREYKRLAFDIDRRYFRRHLVASVACYRKLVGRSQARFFNGLMGDDEHANFRSVWDAVSTRFFTFGRLSTFSYLEYLRIMGLPLDCDDLFLGDRAGSKSHRNGICKVIGRDDLDWHESNPGFSGHYSPEVIEWLTGECAALLADAKARMPGERSVSYFTLESTLCCYKSWHRPNRRYPNVYNDMFHDRIRVAEAAWRERFEVFREARAEKLPAHLRLEDNPADCGLKPRKQNHYRQTGQVIMMDEEWECFRNDFNDEVRRAQGGRSTSVRRAKEAAMVVVGIGGEPATGKTRVVRNVIKLLGKPEQMTFRGAFRKGRKTVTRTMKVEMLAGAKVFVLGSYRGNGFDGTDRLSMAVQPLAVRFLRWVSEDRPDWAVLFEGDRLFNQKFIAEARTIADVARFVVLRVPEKELARRHALRGDSQPETFLKSRRTKVANLMERVDDIEELPNETEAHSDRNAKRIVVFLRGGGRDG